MNADELLGLEQYTLPQARKDELLGAELARLTEHHRAHCEAYDRAVGLMGAPPGAGPAGVPFLPVSLFKTHTLRSILEADVFKTLTSSGTSGQAVSRVFLDRESAARQTRALASIMTAVLGSARRPMLIADTRSVVRDRSSFSARGAGVVGMATFGRDHLYVLDDDMRLDRAALRAWLEKHAGEELLVFGFTFMVWEHLLGALEHGEADLSRATLVHSGGWKRLEQRAVDDAELKRALRAATGLERVFNFYGLAEQIGTVFLECARGRLHAPNVADLIVRDPATWEAAPVGQQGLAQVMSVLPTSYPGHSLLTEDMAEVVAVDDCGCGRLGKAVRFHGRLPRAELRGCSDTAGERM